MAETSTFSRENPPDQSNSSSVSTMTNNRGAQSDENSIGVKNAGESCCAMNSAFISRATTDRARQFGRAWEHLPVHRRESDAEAQNETRAAVGANALRSCRGYGSAGSGRGVPPPDVADRGPLPMDAGRRSRGAHT